MIIGFGMWKEICIYSVKIQYTLGVHGDYIFKNMHDNWASSIVNFDQISREFTLVNVYHNTN
jgi:hypothetical protein